MNSIIQVRNGDMLSEISAMYSDVIIDSLECLNSVLTIKAKFYVVNIKTDWYA